MQGNQGMQRRELMQWFVRCLVGRGKLVCLEMLGLHGAPGNPKNWCSAKNFWAWKAWMVNRQRWHWSTVWIYCTHTHTHIYIYTVYIYIYMCVCVCVCVFVSTLKTFGPTTKHLQVLFPRELIPTRDHAWTTTAYINGPSGSLLLSLDCPWFPR